MRFTGCLLAAAGFILGAADLSRAQAEGDIKPIIDKAMQNLGGKEKLAKFKTTTLKFKGTAPIQGKPASITGEAANQGLDQARYVSEVILEGEKHTTIQVINGDKGWIKSDGELQEMTKEMVADAKEDGYANWISSLFWVGSDQEKNLTLAPLGNHKIGQKEAVGVKVSSKGHRDVSLFFDKKTGLVIKTEMIVPDEQITIVDGVPQVKRTTVKQETFLNEFTEVDGVPQPRKITIKRDGKPFVESEITEIKPQGKLDESFFAKP